MTKRKLTSQAEAKPVDKPKRVSRRIRYTNLCGFNSKVEPCAYCGASRYACGTGPSVSVIFTPHTDKCPIPARLFTTKERFDDYANRKAEFLKRYEERIH